MKLKEKVYDIIFKANTPAGKLFDVILILLICCSLVVVMLDSIDAYDEQYGTFFYICEWIFTIAFTIEYGLRLWCTQMPIGYMLSFYGIVDLLSILPTYLSLFIPGAQHLMAIRVLRVLRIFRIMKFMKYVTELNLLVYTFKESKKKISVFFFFIFTVFVVFGSLMYLVEYDQNSGFTSIPKSIYWTIVTMTTVGYGDIVPQTVLGQLIASFIMVTGFSIIAVPTGIITVEMERARKKLGNYKSCNKCTAEGHDKDATFCKFCGNQL